MNFKGIVIHWTAGGNYPNNIDKDHYHFMIDKDGKIYSGKYTPEDNLSTGDGRYAAHTGGGNTGRIGISMCGMLGFGMGKKQTKYPLTAKQVEATCKQAAELCYKYKIPVANVVTHYEFGKSNPKTSSAGKIDIMYLTTAPTLKPNEVGLTLRKKIAWYYAQVVKANRK